MIINKQDFFTQLEKIIENGALRYVENKETELIKQVNLFKNDPEDIIYKKTHKILDINNINKYEIEYPSKINIHIDFKDANQQMHNITISTKSKILNSMQELIYYINTHIEKTENSYKYLQSNLENNWLITKIKLIIYDTKYMKKPTKIIRNTYIIYEKYCLYIKYLYNIYINILNNKSIKLLSYNKYSIYIKYINTIQEILNLKPHKYKSIIIYINKNIIIYSYNSYNKYITIILTILTINTLLFMLIKWIYE